VDGWEVDCGFYLDELGELKFVEFGGRIGGIYTELTISSMAIVADPPRRCSISNCNPQQNY
jgi:hypothetical protein